MNKLFFSTLLICILPGCSAVKNTTPHKSTQVVEERLPVLFNRTFSPGIPVYTARNINYKRNNKDILDIRFDDFAIASVASQPEKWGYFQFPNIGRKYDGSLQVTWSMNMDSMDAYGTDSHGSANSADGGKTWIIQNKKENIGGILLPNGDRLKITTPKPYSVKNLKLPKQLDSANQSYWKIKYFFYRLNDLPDSCRNVYMQRLKKAETEWKTEQDALDDPDAARYSQAGKFPIVWWGDMKVAADGSLIAGIYPGFLIRKDGTVDPHGHIFFYRSTDAGHSWQIQGRILYQPDAAVDAKSDKRMGLLEPGFEILKDGTFLCVMRTTDGEGNGPMYTSYSKDMGKTWSKIKAITASGVLPRVLQLDNGVVALASGRPGVQLRFLANWKDDTWTQPFEMIPYRAEKDQVSCGYTGLIATGKNSFLIVLSDFRYKTQQGDIRKAIKVREVVVNPQ